MQLIDYIWSDQRIIDGLVDSCLIRQALAAAELPPPSDAELQRAVDEFRRRHGLLTSQATLEWLERRGMTYEQLEFYVADAAQVRALRSAMLGDAVRLHFDRHQRELRRATLLLVHHRRPSRGGGDRGTGARAGTRSCRPPSAVEPHGERAAGPRDAQARRAAGKSARRSPMPCSRRRRAPWSDRSRTVASTS